jgi:PAS domain S-box-containing protein
MDALHRLFNSSGTLSLGDCYLWQADTVWLNVGGDLLAGCAYLALLAALYLFFFVRKRRLELPTGRLPILFAAFMLLGGATHFYTVWTMWHSAYRLEGVLKLLSGVVALGAAIALLRIRPWPIRLPAAAQPQSDVAMRTGRLAASNARLRDEIATRELTEQQLRRSDQRFHLAVQALPGYIYDWDSADGRVERSEGFAGVTGFAPDEAPATSDWWTSRIHPEDVDRVRTAARAAHESDASSFGCEYRARHKAGHYVWVGDHAVLVRGPRAEVIRVVGNVVDISDRKQAEAEHAALLETEQFARNEAERANRLKDEFLGTLSHELRTPLSTIRSWAHLLRLTPDNVAQVTDGAAIIERNALMQARLLGDLLDMSRILAGKLRLDVQPVELASVVQSAIDTVRAAAESKGVRLQVVLAPIAVDVRGDPARLQQVVWNLLSNAIKFTPPDGRVHVSLDRVRSHVEIVISDTGRGIAPEFMPAIFQRFRQADSSSTREHEGLGLGLAIVKQLVELHGGVVRAASAGIGKGASFTIELPIAAVVIAATEGRVYSRSPMADAPWIPRLDGVAVLVVDDQLDSADGAARLLASAGATVSTANSVEAALQKVEGGPPDVIVSDIGMPNRDGFDLIRSLQERESSVPLIALTAFARAEDRTRTILAGFDAHITKPADPAELITTVAAVRKRSRLAHERSAEHQ